MESHKTRPMRDNGGARGFQRAVEAEFLHKEGSTVATFVMLSTLTDEGAKTIKTNPGRIKEVNQELERMGVRVQAQWATLGPYDKWLTPALVQRPRVRQYSSTGRPSAPAW